MVMVWVPLIFMLFIVIDAPPPGTLMYGVYDVNWKSSVALLNGILSLALLFAFLVGSVYRRLDHRVRSAGQLAGVLLGTGLLLVSLGEFLSRWALTGQAIGGAASMGGAVVAWRKLSSTI